ncbi:integrase family protein [Bradyrhizobium sp. Ai1a-2]|uniref:tyrosine-type recombinase/integrase n=1 Tax=Bradyrhizobium sp. Ai1a-2 TaxID=196490 RepID=UPI000408358B|nr:integrase family protein [Bradyrhizobium sp. Ai1a-2]
MTAPTNIELTDAIVRAATCPDGKTQAYLRDTLQPGLAVRLRTSGSRTFVYEHTRPGQKGTHRTTIGPFPRFKIQAARKQAAILAGQRAQGTDLIAYRREQKEVARRAAKSKAVTVGTLLAEDGTYELDLKARHYKNIQTALSALRRNLLPAHKATDIRQLTRQDITAAMDKLTAAGKAGAAQDLRKHTSTFLTWTTDTKGLTDFNVMTGYRKPKETRAQRLTRKSKQRALLDEEIRKVWEATAKLGAFGQLVRLALLGGPRRSEPTMIEWQRHVMVDRVTFDSVWTKMGLHHDIPRTALADQVLDDAKRFQRASSDLVFPSWKKDGARISGFSQLMKQLVEEAGTAKFTMHDLRRTIRTIMSRCGYDNDIQRLCVGQKPKGIDQVYNKDEQWAIRKMAFEAAHAYIAAAIEGKSTEAVLKHQRAQNPQNTRKIELLARLAELHTEA